MKYPNFHMSEHSSSEHRLALDSILRLYGQCDLLVLVSCQTSIFTGPDGFVTIYKIE